MRIAYGIRPGGARVVPAKKKKNSFARHLGIKRQASGLSSCVGAEAADLLGGGAGVASRGRLCAFLAAGFFCVGRFLGGAAAAGFFRFLDGAAVGGARRGCGGTGRGSLGQGNGTSGTGEAAVARAGPPGRRAAVVVFSRRFFSAASLASSSLSNQTSVLHVRPAAKASRE